MECFFYKIVCKELVWSRERKRPQSQTNKGGTFFLFTFDSGDHRCCCCYLHFQTSWGEHFKVIETLLSRKPTSLCGDFQTFDVVALVVMTSVACYRPTTQLSCEKVMFSVMPVCHSVDRGVPSVHGPGSSSNWTHLNLFSLDHTVQEPPDMFKRVPYETCILG